jgi:predicted transcriptional regulator
MVVDQGPKSIKEVLIYYTHPLTGIAALMRIKDVEVVQAHTIADMADIPASTGII